MTSAQKKAFVARMAAARKKSGKGKRPAGTKGLKRNGSATGTKGLKRSRRNSGGDEARALQVYDEFHGPGAKGRDVVIDLEYPIKTHHVLSGIGKLVQIKISTYLSPRVEVTLGFKGTYLAQDTKKTQLFIEGGNQAVNLADFNIRGPIHELEPLGEMTWVFYDTEKTHLGDDGGDAIYKHRFGSVKPLVIYDTRNKLLMLAGGGYDMPPEGIRN